MPRIYGHRRHSLPSSSSVEVCDEVDIDARLSCLDRSLSHPPDFRALRDQLIANRCCTPMPASTPTVSEPSIRIFPSGAQNLIRIRGTNPYHTLQGGEWPGALEVPPVPYLSEDHAALQRGGDGAGASPSSCVWVAIGAFRPQSCGVRCIIHLVSSPPLPPADPISPGAPVVHLLRMQQHFVNERHGQGYPPAHLLLRQSNGLLV